MPRTKQCGVYKITCLCNDKFYIGSSSDIVKRWGNHRWSLRHNKHNNQYLQNAWNQYGESNFAFEILELCSKNKQFELEQEYLDKLKPFAKFNNGYNLLEDAGNQINKSKILFTDYDDCGLPHKVKERDCLKEVPITIKELYKTKKELQEYYDGYIAMQMLYDDMVMCDPDYE